MNRSSRLGRRTARQLLDGRPATRTAEVRLARLLDALGDQDTPSEATVPAHLLEAFTRRAREASAQAAVASAGRGGSARPGVHARSRTRSRRIGRALTVKAAFVLVFSGATVGAAAADVLPPPAQSAVHELFGSWGVPAPSDRDVRIHPQAPGVPGALMDTTMPAHPAAPAPAAAAGKAAPAPAHAPNSDPATPAEHCAPPAVLPRHAAGPGAARADDRGCRSESDGYYHPGHAGHPGHADRAGDGPEYTVPGGEPAERASGLRSALDPGREQRALHRND